MSVKVIAESDVLSCMSVLTREGEDSSFLLSDGVRVFERSRFMEVLNDISFRVDEHPDGGREDTFDGRGSENRQREPEPRRGPQAEVAAEADDRVLRRRKTGLGRRLDADEGKLAIAQAELAKAKSAASSRSSRKRRGR